MIFLRKTTLSFINFTVIIRVVFSKQSIPLICSSNDYSMVTIIAARPKRNKGEIDMAQILVIDDHRPTLESLEAILTRHGFNVDTAANGLEGMEHARKAPPDLVITDIIMPKKEGLSVIRDLRKKNARLKIMAITGGDDTFEPDLLTDVARITGADTMLKKPIQMDELLESVHHLLTERRAS